MVKVAASCENVQSLLVITKHMNTEGRDPANISTCFLSYPGVLFKALN